MPKPATPTLLSDPFGRLSAHVAGLVTTRIRVPRDLDAVTTIGHEDDPDGAGLTEREVERMWRGAVALYRTGAHPAVALVLRRHGRIVLNRAIGHAWGNGPGEARGAEKVLATTDTPYCVFSSAKGYTATIVHVLLERGVFGLDDLVADHIPGYERHGKGSTTIRHVLTHRAGVPFLPAATADLDRLDDREFIRDTLCRLRPIAKPGTLLAYHALTGGYILGEIVQATTGRGIRENLAEHVLDPLGLRWSNYGVDAADLPLVAPVHRTGLPILPPVSTYVSKVLSGSFDDAVRKANDPRFLTAVVPSANTVTTATEMSRFYEMLGNGGEVDGVRVLRPETIRQAVTPSARMEPDLALGGLPMRYGLGYMLGAEHISLYGQHADAAFGHLGLMNVIGWADPERALAGALLTSGKALVYPGIEQFFGLPQRIAKTVPKVPAGELPF